MAMQKGGGAEMIADATELAAVDANGVTILWGGVLAHFWHDTHKATGWSSR